MTSHPEPLILSIDTATEQRSAAVSAGARLLALRAGEGRNTHSANVLGEIDAVLSEAGVELAEVELFAAAAGPGSFTGLRAGLSTLKAFAQTLGRRAVGVPTLHAVALASGGPGTVLAALPAGRGEVFAQMLRVTEDGSVEELELPAHVAPAALLERAAAAARNGLRWAGSGSVLMLEVIRARALAEGIEFVEGGEGNNASGWSLKETTPAVAGHVAALALEAYRRGRTVAAEELRAIYVRPSDAELKEQCRVPADTAR
ncbi:MAG TPA: tRNA (adenosine(37)-N6)-threonylcarbamoyltransferase complex dimerization subunit type 1 TsaB [Pyrinomonadaceae bacterium]|nr:tRNA (adenosine(37)-N6)-threonylcarbamoyltransferase complex dimerization subunit type 1 TsaB [Pyrinomonadaceae bacterium]